MKEKELLEKNNRQFNEKEETKKAISKQLVSKDNKEWGATRQSISKDNRGRKTLKTQQKESADTTPNIKYKDSVFRMIFKEKRHLLELYNAINNTSYTNENDLEITTLENAVYMAMKNDVSCMLDMNLQLYEHQSTYNPNMPLRDLFYVSAQYEKYVIHKDLHASKVLRLPVPRFVVFYNGIAVQPELRVMKLSDAFEHEVEKPELELIVTQYNINDGFNEALKEKSPLLMQYMQFVSKVRKYLIDKPLKEAVEYTIEECIREDILKEFLLQNKAEVCVKNHKSKFFTHQFVSASA